MILSRFWHPQPMSEGVNVIARVSAPFQITHGVIQLVTIDMIYHFSFSATT